MKVKSSSTTIVSVLSYAGFWFMSLKGLWMRDKGVEMRCTASLEHVLIGPES